MVIKRRELDLNLLPDVSTLDAIRRFEPDVRAVLNHDSDFPELNDRADSSLYLLSRVDSDTRSRYNSAYFRAGLNDFYSLEDAARRDCRKIGLKLEPPLIRESPNPLVHMMYLLRHVNVHATLSETTAHETTVISRMGGVEKEHDWQSVVLSKPTFEQVLLCREARKYYDPVELEKATEWLDSEQLTFGVGLLLMRGVSAYCREVLTAIGRLEGA